MVAPVVVYAAIAAVQLGAGMFGGAKASEAASKAAHAQMRLTKIQRAEELRQQEQEYAHTLSTARLATYASNIQMSGSGAAYVNFLESEQNIRLAYSKRAAIAEQRAIRAGAAGAGDSLRIQGITSALGTGLSALGSFGGGGGDSFSKGFSSGKISTGDLYSGNF